MRYTCIKNHNKPNIEPLIIGKKYKLTLVEQFGYFIVHGVKNNNGNRTTVPRNDVSQFFIPSFIYGK
jgi:hypothetical protein